MQQVRMLGSTGRAIGAVSAMMVLASCATSAVTVARRTAKDAARLAVFEPRPSDREVRVNYEPLDELLDPLVLMAGPSLRRYASRPRPVTGTKFHLGHTSPIRLEGNKLMFSRMTSAQREELYLLVEDLVAFARRVSVPTLPKTEQLAYWLNLHNMLVIAEIAKRYPVLRPRRLTIGDDGLPFHDAPLVTIEGVKLSLRDIRVGIVYKYWDDPRVMYGFFHGDLAGPSIRNKAYRGDSLSLDLGVNANEFINSLRGVRRRRDVMVVSPLYEEARPRLFQDWPEDLRMHLRDFSERDVDIILDETEEVAFSKLELRVADVVGGQPSVTTSPIVGGKYGPVRGHGGAVSDEYTPFGKQYPFDSPAFSFAIIEYKEKFQALTRLKKTTGKGYVEIIDIPFDDGVPADQGADDDAD